MLLVYDYLIFCHSNAVNRLKEVSLRTPGKNVVLERLTNLIIACPGWVFLSTCFVILLSTIVAILIPKDLSFTGFLGENDPEIVEFNREFSAFGTYSMLLLLLEGADDEIARVLEVLRERLPEETAAHSVLPASDPKWFMERAPWLWPDAIFESVIRDVRENGERPATLNSVEIADRFIEEFVKPTPNTALVSIEIIASPLDMSVGGENFLRIEKVTRGIVEELGVDVSVDFTGLSAVGAQDQSAVVSRVIILTPFTIIGVLLLVYLIEPRVSRVIVAGIALGGSVLMGLAVVGMIQGRITLGSAFFGLLLLGLGIDFGIHLLVALRDGRSHGLSPDDSLRYAVDVSAEPIVLGAVSSALAFGVLTLIPNSLTQDMGLTAFFGVLLGMVLMLTLLPAGWLILERRHAHHDAPAKLTIPGLEGLVRFSIVCPKRVLAFGVILAVVGACGIPRYKTETDLEKIFSNDVPALDVADRIQELFGVATTTYTARVESLAQAREWKESLEQLPGIASVRSPTDVLRGDMEERFARVEAVVEGYREGPGGNADGLYARLRVALEAGPIVLETLPKWLSAGIVSADGSLALSITPEADSLDAEVLDREIRKIRSVAPTATGVPVIVRLATMGMVKYVPYMMPMVFVVVTLVLIAVFRDRRLVLLALLPVVVATSVTFGFYFWFDLQFSIMTIVVVPVILGLGVDDGIHIVERIRRYGLLNAEELHEAVMGVGRPIFLTTSTTCVSFAALLFTNHSGLESIAHFMLVGIPLCFLTSVTMLPAAVKISIDRREKRESG